jgi:hypothetical protein
MPTQTEEAAKILKGGRRKLYWEISIILNRKTFLQHQTTEYNAGMR